MEQKYAIKMNTPIGLEEGTITMAIDGDNVSGILKVMGSDNNFDGKINGNEFEFSGSIKKFISKINYSAKGTIDGNELKATAQTNFGVMTIEGNKVSG